MCGKIKKFSVHLTDVDVSHTSLQFLLRPKFLIFVLSVYCNYIYFRAINQVIDYNTDITGLLFSPNILFIYKQHIAQTFLQNNSNGTQISTYITHATTDKTNKGNM